jgi:hypothetical protein
VGGDQSKRKEGELFSYSVVDKVILRNGLVPDHERLPEIMKKNFTQHMADLVACSWSEDQGGNLNGEDSDLLTCALTTLVGKENDEDFGGNTMDTYCKQETRTCGKMLKCFRK